MTDNTTTYGEGEGSGAGAFVYTQGPDSPVTVTRSTFANNAAQRVGGGLSVTTSGANSYVTIGGLGEEDGNTFTGNSTLYDSGGGFSVTTNGTDAPITVQGNVAKGNASHWGGGFFLDTNGFGDSSLTVTNNILGGEEEGEGNTSETDGGGAFMWVGGGITFENNTVVGNTSASLGGGAAWNVDREETNAFDANILHNTFEGNSAIGGGGMDITGDCDCEISIDANRVSANTAGSGGGISFHPYTTGGAANMRNNVIDQNVANGQGGAGVLVSDNGTGLNFVNNTVYGNRLTSTDEDDYILWGGRRLVPPDRI